MHLTVGSAIRLRVALTLLSDKKRFINPVVLKQLNCKLPIYCSSWKQFSANIVNMSSVAELLQEQKQLEAKVVELVGKLESKKGPNEIKVNKDHVIRPKEEKEAADALEKLNLAENNAAQPSDGKPTVSGNEKKQPEQQQQQKKEAKPKGGAKEPEKPVDISRLDLRIGRIVEVDKHPDADSLYVEKIDCGDPSGPRTVISGLVKHVPIEEMKDRNVVVLCNLKPVKMRGILSEAMVMCASTPDKVELLGTPDGAKPGDRLVFESYPGEPDAQLNPKKKVWEQVSPDIKTNDQGVAMYKECQFRLAGKEGLFKSNLKNVNIR